MNEHEDGGPAFPVAEGATFDDKSVQVEGFEGMSLLAYFMAHAPTNPPAWFLPEMPQAPAVPSIWSIQDDALRQDVRAADEAATDPVTPEGVAWLQAHDEARRQQEAWQSEFRRQLWIQWPRAWAELQLAELAK